MDVTTDTYADLESVVEGAVARGHIITDVPYGDDMAPGVFARCMKCSAYLRWYKGRPGGEAHVTYCPIKAEQPVQPKTPNVRTAPINQIDTNEELEAMRKEELDEQYGNLNWWCYTVHQYAKEKGWWDEEHIASRNFGDLIALLHSEVSEAYEEYRDGHQPNETYYNPDKPGKPEGIPSELADVLIRIFDMCGHYGIDLDTIVREKHEYNRTRPYRHGGKVS